MDTNLKFSLITTIIALGVIVAFSLTAIPVSYTHL
ncbi:YnhF family membrane protein, partial [Klebsiella pneumoniae]|nr:YnhF family membrane protein [Klebsiella pneumoniae]